MSISRFQIRPIASRRLRAALLLVLALGLLGISQTRFTLAEGLVAVLALCAIAADGWRRTRVPDCTLMFENRPLGCRLIDSSGVEVALNGVRSSVYPWLIVLKFEVADGAEESARATTLATQRWLRRPIVLLPDSLALPSKDSWRHVLVWSQQLRRSLANR